MYSSRSVALVIVCTVLLVFSSVFVGLRFKVRNNTKAGLGADDFTILAALLSQCVAAAITIYGAVAGGYGDSEILFTHPAEASRFAKLLFAGPLIFAITITLIKISTLFLYKSIFVRKGFHMACHVMMTLTMGWFIASIFPAIFQCKPVSAAWTAPDQYRVINLPVYLLAMAAINTAMDLTIVCLPLFVIRTLHMSFKRKLLVSGIFLLGLFCIIASAVRLYYFVRLRNSPTELNVTTDDVIWSFIEAQMSIVAACLPTLAPLFRGGRDPGSIIRSVQSMLSLRSITSRASPSGSKGSHGSNEQKNTVPKRAWLPLNSNNSRTNAITCEPGVELDTIQQASGGIVVQKSLRSEVQSV